MYKFAELLLELHDAEGRVQRRDRYEAQVKTHLARFRAKKLGIWPWSKWGILVGYGTGIVFRGSRHDCEFLCAVLHTAFSDGLFVACSADLDDLEVLNDRI